MTSPAQPVATRPLGQTAEAPSTISSAHARCTTYTVGFLRGATILCSALVLASLGFLLAPAFGRNQDARPLLWALIAVGILGATACAYAEIVFGVKHARLEEKALRQRLLKTFFASTLTSSRGVPPARQLAVMTDSVERVTEYRQIYWGATVASVLAPVLILLYVTALDWVTGLLILLVIPLAPATIWFFFRFFRKVSGNSRAKREALSVSYLDAIRQLVPIRLFGAGQRIEDRLRAEGEANRQAVMKLLASNQLVIIVMDAVFLVLLICWSLVLISWRASSGALALEQALSASLLLPLLLEPLAQVAGFFYIGMGGRASQRVIDRVLAGKPLGAGHPGGPPAGGHPTNQPGGKHPAKESASGRRPASSSTPGSRPAAGSASAATGRPAPLPSQSAQEAASWAASLNRSAAISLRNLGYSYGRGQVFSGLNLDIEPGERLAITGVSGVGKSTLLALLRGTLPLQTGAVAVGGQNLADLTPEAAPQQAASLAQSTWLFTGTIADNLRLAKPQANEQQLWAVLEQAHLAQDVQAMEAGLETQVGEGGGQLSGGQAQRLALARALLSGRKIIFLDEPTAQVDPLSEQEILASLTALGPDYTLVMVTHRPALLKIADRVLELSPAGIKFTRGGQA